MSSTILEIIFPPMAPDAPKGEAAAAFLAWVEAQREEIVSEENLKQAVRELLPESSIDQAVFLAEAKRGLSVEELRGTDLISIKVRSGDRRFSADLANRLAENYLKNHPAEPGERGPIIHKKAEPGAPVGKTKGAVAPDGIEKKAPAEIEPE